MIHYILCFYNFVFASGILPYLSESVSGGLPPDAWGAESSEKFRQVGKVFSLRHKKRYFFAGASGLLMLCAVFSAEAQANMASSIPYGSNTKDTSREIREKEAAARLKKLAESNVDMSADSYEYTGSNLVAKGHVVIHIKGLQITANSAVVNLVTKDLEAAGNVVLAAMTPESPKICSSVRKIMKPIWKIPWCSFL